MRVFSSLLGIALTVVVVGCGSNSAASPAASGSATPFRVTLITGVNTPVGNYPEMGPAMQVAVTNINKAGGLKGHPIVLNVCNNGGNSAGSATCARQAVAEKVDDVIETTGFTPATIPILDEARIARVGSPTQPAFTGDYTDTFDAPLFGGGTYATWPFIAKGHGATRLAVLQVDLAVAYTNSGVAKAASAAAGVDYVGTVVAPLAATDFAPYVQQLKTLHADAVGLLVTGAQIGAVRTAEQSLGLSILNISQTATLTEAVLQSYGQLSNGILGPSPVPPPTATNLTAVKTFNKQMDAAGNKTKTIQALTGWLTIYALQALAQQVKGDVTGASLLDAAHQARNVNVLDLFKWSPGTPGPKDYPNASNGTQYVVVAKDGSWNLADSKPLDIYALTGTATK